MNRNSHSYHRKLIQRQTPGMVLIHLAHQQIKDLVIHRDTEQVQQTIALVETHISILIRIELIEHLKWLRKRLQNIDNTIRC